MSGIEPLAAAAIVPEVGALLAPAAATAATAATGAAAAGAGALGAGALSAAEAGAGAGGLLAAAAPEAAGAMSYVTPSILSAPLPTTELLGGMYEGATAGAEATPAWQAALGQAGKAASAYGKVNQAMGGGQQPMQAPAPRSIFQGEAPKIAQERQHGSGNQFAQMLLEQRRRGMLG